MLYFRNNDKTIYKKICILRTNYTIWNIKQYFIFFFRTLQCTMCKISYDYFFIYLIWLEWNPCISHLKGSGKWEEVLRLVSRVHERKSKDIRSKFCIKLNVKNSITIFCDIQHVYCCDLWHLLMHDSKKIKDIKYFSAFEMIFIFSITKEKSGGRYEISIYSFSS